MWKLGDEVEVTIKGKITEAKLMDEKIRYVLENKYNEIAFIYRKRGDDGITNKEE